VRQQALNLTFDDGPDEQWTGAVLRALRENDARATFFMVGERVQASPELAGSVLDSGGDIQLHCHRHVRHSELSEQEIEDDTRQGLAALAEVGVRPSRWRTPWGIRTPATERVARRHRLQLTHWTIDTHDWRGDDPATMLAHASDGLSDGGVVLMHDALGPGALRSGCQNTVELLAPLIAAARDAGLEPSSLGR
jgi:peptidoglycan/xylan/chitin deacetylase (PgdA/CDA1 family)